MRVYFGGWGPDVVEARRRATRAFDVGVAEWMDGRVTHLVVGERHRGKRAYQEYSEANDVPILSPEEFLVRLDAILAAQPSLGPTEAPGPPNSAFGRGLWLLPMVTCGVATPFSFAYLASTRGTWLHAVWGVLYGFLTGFGFFAVVEGGGMTAPGVAAVALSAVAGGVHFALADGRARR